MAKDTEIIAYYDELAADYEELRFKNTYGEFIHHQERTILHDLALNTAKQYVLNLGCGTGRFMEYADHGVDVSSNMIKRARSRFTHKQFHIEDAESMHFADCSMELVFSFHVLMHLSQDKCRHILQEVSRIVRQGGRFVFDVPSKKRRQLTGHKQQGWHGASAYSLENILGMTGGQWKLRSVTGVMFFPIHRVPAVLRSMFTRLDSVMCRSPLKEYSSYVVIELEKR